MKKTAAIVRFELARTARPMRLLWWLVLAGFPIFLTLLLRSLIPWHSAPEQAHYSWAAVLYLLIPGIACTLGVFVSTAPAIATELEQRSWVYLAIRPNGIFHLLLGKLIVGFLWAFTASLTASMIAVPLTTYPDRFRLFSVIVQLSALSAAGYAALYILIGTMFPRRAMVFCVAYTLGVEGLLGFLPAVVNKLTLQYRLRSLMVKWCELEKLARGPDKDVMELVADPGSPAAQVFWILSIAIGCFAAAMVITRAREFSDAAQSDV